MSKLSSMVGGISYNWIAKTISSSRPFILQDGFRAPCLVSSCLRKSLVCVPCLCSAFVPSEISFATFIICATGRQALLFSFWQQQLTAWHQLPNRELPAPNRYVPCVLTFSCFLINRKSVKLLPSTITEVLCVVSFPPPTLSHASISAFPSYYY
jgi:hypothetical protein